MPDYSTYLSPFSWRYGSKAMRQIWSETNKRQMWRDVWVALAQVQSEFGLITPDQVEDLRKHQAQVNIERALELEAEIQHDLMAELLTFAEQCPLGGGSLHMGATSMDIEDNAEILRMRQSLDLVNAALRELLASFAEKIDLWADLPIMGFTHLQPAEPTTLGYRLAFYAQDLLEDLNKVRDARENLRAKGFTGAVGTSAAYSELIGMENLETFEAHLSQALNLPFFPVTSQVYPRKQDFFAITALAGIAASLHKLAFDLRFLQSPVIGEVSEPFGRSQVGSSAMPFKRNPINAEKIDSLARLLAQMPRIAWDNAANSLLERTLDDSANRRTLLPEAFLIADELLRVATKIVKGLVVNKTAVQKNFETFGPFAATERLLMAAARRGADRQAVHARLRDLSMQAWESVKNEQGNPLATLIKQDPEIIRFLPESEIDQLMDFRSHIGDAPQKARLFAAEIRNQTR